MGLLDVWASEGDIAEPELTKIKVGWEFAELPPHDYMNWIERNFGEKINHILANGISKWHQQNQYDEGSVVNHNKTVWFANNFNSNSEPSDANVNWTKIRDGAPTFFPAPSIIEPVNGGFIVNGNVALEVFDNHQFYLANPTEVVLSIAENEQFSGQILETVNYTGAGVYTINHQFIAGTVYYIRAFLQNEDYVGQKSEVVVASTAPADSDIATPTLTVEGAPNEVPESPLLSVSAFVDNNSETTYQFTQIQIIRDGITIFNVFEDISSNWEYTIPTGLLNPETEYTFRVRHIGEDNNASEFVEVVGVTLDVFAVPLMVVAHLESPYITAYEYDIASFTTITGGDAPDALPNTGNGVAFSPDGSLCVVAHRNSPNVTAYTVDGNSFTKIEGNDAPDALLDDSYGVAFSPDGSLCVVAHVNSPFVTAYTVDGNSFTKIEGSDAPDALPNTGYAVAFSPALPN